MVEELEHAVLGTVAQSRPQLRDGVSAIVQLRPPQDGVGATVAAAVDVLHDGCARLREVVSTCCEPDSACPVRAGCAAYPAMQDVLDVVATTETQLVSAAERAVEERNMLARLSAAAQGLVSIESTESLEAAIPELALVFCSARAVALVQVSKDGGAVQVVTRCGQPFQAPQALLDEEARGAVRAGSPRLEGEAARSVGAELTARRAGHRVAVPLTQGASGFVLVLERSPAGTAFDERDVEHLVVYGSLAGTALARTRAADELQAAAARDAAILGAIRDGVIAVDREGVVRALNQAAATVLGVRREDVLGRRLRSVGGLAALANALAVAPDQVIEVVPLARGEVVLRAQVHDGGVVATIRDVATEHTIAQRIVGSSARYTFDQIIGASPALLRVIEDARRAARSDIPILISGESGTGKELLAQAIHNASVNAAAPFIGINVTAIPRDLLESELFGYEGGTFTGARASGRAGKFELAGRGTLLLDEIGDMPLEMQGKLLRVLQERILQRLGSARDIQVRARIVATSHRNLAEAVSAGRFRLDLFHRLCVLHLTLPPLRERREDIPLLVDHQLRLHAERTGRRTRIAPHVLAALQAYDWPGNVRELVNVIEGEISVLPPGADQLTRIPPSLLEAPPRALPASSSQDELLPLEELERRACEHTLAHFKGNVARAARALGVAKGTLYSKMKRYGLGPPDANEAAGCHAAEPIGAPRVTNGRRF